MKEIFLKRIIVLIGFNAIFTALFCQSVVFTDDASYTSGHTSTVLDVKSTTKGFLIPRMTLAQRPSGPATGLMIYQTDNTPGFYYYNGSGWALVGPTVDGSETKVSAGTNVSVTGSGTAGSPYTVNATAADGSETKIDGGTNVTITGSGTSASHYVISTAVADGSETKVDAGTNVTVTGSGTSASHYVINATGGDGSETKIDAGTNVTITGSGTTASHYVINSAGGDGSETKVTAGTGIVKTGTGTTGDPYILSYSIHSITQAQRDGLTPYAGQLILCNNCGISGELQVYNGTTWTNLAGGAASAPFVVGDAYQGGKIAYILQSGDPGYVAGVTHGIIVATSDQSTSASWGCYNTSISGADGTALGTGHQNTEDIVKGCATAGIAARLCNDLVSGGYSDWYLPSSAELHKLHVNKVAIGGLTNTDYWSSSETGSGTATIVNLTGGTINGAGNKNTGYYVRAIRRF